MLLEAFASRDCECITMACASCCATWVVCSSSPARAGSVSQSQHYYLHPQTKAGVPARKPGPKPKAARLALEPTPGGPPPLGPTLGTPPGGVAPSPRHAAALVLATAARQHLAPGLDPSPSPNPDPSPGTPARGRGRGRGGRRGRGSLARAPDAGVDMKAEPSSSPAADAPVLAPSRGRGRGRGRGRWGARLGAAALAAAVATARGRGRGPGRGRGRGIGRGRSARGRGRAHGTGRGEEEGEEEESKDAETDNEASPESAGARAPDRDPVPPSRGRGRWAGHVKGSGRFAGARGGRGRGRGRWGVAAGRGEGLADTVPAESCVFVIHQGELLVLCGLLVVCAWASFSVSSDHDQFQASRARLLHVCLAQRFARARHGVFGMMRSSTPSLTQIAGSRVSVNATRLLCQTLTYCLSISVLLQSFVFITFVTGGVQTPATGRGGGRGRGRTPGGRGSRGGRLPRGRGRWGLTARRCAATLHCKDGVLK